MKNFNDLNDDRLKEIKGIGPKGIEKIKAVWADGGKIDSPEELKALVPTVNLDDQSIHNISFSKTENINYPKAPLFGANPIPIKTYNVLGNMSIGVFTKYFFTLKFNSDDVIGKRLFVGFNSNLKKEIYQEYIIPNNKEVFVDISKKSFINNVFKIKILDDLGAEIYNQNHNIEKGDSKTIEVGTIKISSPLILKIQSDELKGLSINTKLIYEKTSSSKSFNVTESSKFFVKEITPEGNKDIDGIEVSVLEGSKKIYENRYFWKDLSTNSDNKKTLKIDIPEKYVEVKFKIKDKGKTFIETGKHIFDNFKIILEPVAVGENIFKEFTQELIVKNKIAVLRTRTIEEPSKLSILVKNLKNENVRILDKIDYPFSSTTRDFEIEVNSDIEFSYNDRIGKYIYNELPQKVVGHLVTLNGMKKMSNTPIVFEIKDEKYPKFYPIIHVKTDSSGRFSFDFPRVHIESAQAKILIKNSNDKSENIQILPIKLEKRKANLVEEVNSGNIKGSKLEGKELSFFPTNVLLVIERDLSEDEDCSCNDTECGIKFKHEGEVLDEFTYYSVVRTTEPNIQKYTLLDEGEVKLDEIIKESTIPSSAFDPSILSRSIHKGILKKYLHPKKGLTANGVLRAFEESTAIKLKNKLSAGPINKAPGRQILDFENQIDWDDEPTIYQATSISHGHLLQFKQEWVSDGYSLGDLLYSLPLAPGQKKQIVVFDWERREKAVRRESLDAADSLENSMSRDRDINEIVKGALSENMKGGSDSKTGGFGVGLGLAGIFKGVTAVLGISGGSSKAKSGSWQSSSRKTSLSSLHSLRDNTVQSANSVRSQRATVIQSSTQGESFSVQTESVANYNHCHAMTIQYFEVLRHLLIRQRLSSVQECLFIPLMITGFDFKKTLRWKESLYRFVRSRRLRKGFDAIDRIENNYEGSDLPEERYADELIQNVYGHLHIRFELTRPKDVDDDFDEPAWGFIGRILSINPREFYNNFLKSQSRKDAIFQRELAPKIAERFVQSLRFTAHGDGEVELPLDATLVSSYQAGKSLHVSLNYAGEEPTIQRSDIKYIEISGGILNPLGTADNPYFPLINLLPANSKVIVWGGALNYQTKYTSDYLFRNSRIKNDLTGFDNVKIYTPLNRRELRNPKDEDVELANNLVDHLNANVEFYHKILWMQMSPERLYMCLDGCKVVDYSNDQFPGGIERSVASVVENKIIGVAGNSIIMPVASGFRLDPNIRGNEEIDLFDLYKPTTPIEPVKVSIPTKGVFAEAIMGQCNSCEKIDEDRFWRWSQEPIPDSPTEILPIDTSSRKNDNPDLTPTPFSNPMIVQQNAPSAPDPSGIAAASNLLNREFRDMAGLKGTQENAMNTYNKNMDTASAMGKEAASMWKLNQQLEAIKSEKKRGNIDEDKARELSEKALNNSLNESDNSAFSDIQKIQELEKDGIINKEIAEKLINGVTEDYNNKGDSIVNKSEILDRIKAGSELKYKSGDEEIQISSTKSPTTGSVDSPAKIDGDWITKLTTSQKATYNNILNQARNLPDSKKDIVPNPTLIDSSNLSAFNVQNPTSSTDASKPTTVIIEYFAADNNLSAFSLEDLNEIVNGNNSNEIAFLGLVDFADNKGLFVVEIDSNNDLKVLEQWTVNQNNNLDAVQVFLAKALKTHEGANKTAIGFWGHGLQSYYQKNPSKTNYRDLLIFPDENTDAKGGHGSISLEDMQRLFNWAFTVSGRGAKKVDIIFLDACLLQTIEINSIFSSHTKVLVASQNLEPGDGMNYKGWIKRSISAGVDTLDAASWAKLEVDSYASFYTSNHTTIHWTHSAFKTEEINLLETKLLDWVNKILELSAEEYSKEVNNIQKAFNNVFKFYWENGKHDDALNKECTIDLIGFMIWYKQFTSSTELINLTKDVIDTCSALILGNKVENSLFGGSTKKGANGICIWFPKKHKYTQAQKEELDDIDKGFYPQIDFVKNTKWMEFCQKYVSFK